MADTSCMARYGARLVTNGYTILPIGPGTKKPGQFRRGAWADYPEWNRHAERATTEVEIATWSAWPDCGIGIVGGAVAAVDIDIVEDAELALQIEQLARARLGDTPALRIGKAPKRMLFYRTAEPFRGIKRHPLEVLCLGQQFVAYAVHPETGAPYAWPEEGLADLDISDLPEITADAAAAFLDEAYALLPEALRQRGLTTASPTAEHLRNHSQIGTLPAIRAALAWLPNAELDYDSWMRIGMALKGALGDAGADLFAEWSAQAAKDVPQTTDKAWASFKPDRIGAGTIYHLAMERGWQPDASLCLDGAAVCDGEHPAAGLLSRLGEAHGSEDREMEVQAVRVPPPPPLSQLDGALAMMIEHILASAIRPQPWLAVGASLTALGTLMGRKVRTDSDLRSNLYVIGLAESGGGKDHARKAIKEMFAQAGFASHLGGERIASGAGLISALTRQPASLFQIDEFGKFMANVVDKHRAPKHLSEIWDLFTELATSAATTFMGAEYADQKERPRQDIIQPCACVHGVTAPGPFWESLSTGSLQDGSLARFLVFRSEDDIPDRNRTPRSLRDVPQPLLDALKAIAAAGGSNRGNLAQTGSATIVPAPLLVKMDPSALAVFDDLDLEMTTRQRAAIGTEQGAVLARVWENTAKVALIKAVSADPSAPIIREPDALWARELVAHCIGTLLLQSERHLADTRTEKHHKKVLEIIRAAGRKGIRRRDLTRKTQFLDLRVRQEVLQTLIESEQITSVSTKTKGRSADVYRIG
ncbi:PriCT-2 domain-containing protein [Tateyamaria pelophila]|uniref:PriCT-2 domain-containing protein n=1 Tax=Tateyamaria pelophila TaxID=328415 RepID=UPI001CBC3CA6|nr:PriCT-2 domain-containing protein [Tateyamaria pelophila]